MPRSSSRPIRKVALASVAAAALVAASLATTSQIATASTSPGSLTSLAPALKLNARLDKATGKVAVFVRTEGAGALSVDATAKGGSLSGRPQSSAAKNRVADIRRTNSAVTKAIASADPAVTTLYTTAYTVPGVAVIADASVLKAIAARSDVVSISPITQRSVPKPVTTKGEEAPLNSNDAIYTRTLNAWQQTGHTGTGINIAVIDTGLDYTHADFGGPGTTAAYDEALASTAAPASSLYDSAKFLGGTDFAGATYNADPDSDAYDPDPAPDANPIDGRGGGHGSHVAGTAAGFGENADKTTFTGDYGDLTTDSVNDMYIGPGSAPNSGLYSLKVFGDGGGSTDLTGAALDWVGQALTQGKNINVVNMSLGSDYSNPDDPDNAKVDALVARGVLPVMSAGNSGDFTDVGGSPANSENGLSVAAASSGSAVYDGIDVTAPAGISGTYNAQYSIAYTKPLTLRADVFVPSAAGSTGCAPFSSDDAARIAGKIVLLHWNDAALECGSVTRFTNATNAGAAGVLLGGSVNVFDAGISGNADIPGAEITKDAYAAILRTVDGGDTVTVSFKDSLRLYKSEIVPSLTDTLATFSSRGVHGSYDKIVKPDVAAPGVNVLSVLSGAGTGRTSESGTSMASPDAAGIAALVFEAHDGWTAKQVKADIMNTATHDLKDADGNLYSTISQGTGRIDALQAVTNQVTVRSDENEGLITASYGAVAVSKPLTAKRTLVLHNSGNTSQTYSVAYASRIAAPGVTFTVSASTVVVPARGDVTVTLTMKIPDPKALRKVIDPTQNATAGVGDAEIVRDFVASATGSVQFTPADSTRSPLRLSVFAAPKPISANTGATAVFAKKTSTTAVLGISGTTLKQGTGVQAYTGLTAAFVLGATSPVKTFPAGSPQQSLAGADLIAVGAASTAPLEKDRSDGILSFGVKTNGPIANPGVDGAPEVYIDTDGDGEADFVTYVTKSTTADATFVTTIDLVSGKAVDVEPFNADYAGVDVNTFDSSVAVLPVSLKALGFTSKSKKTSITYEVATESAYAPGLASTGSYVVDQTNAATFDVFAPSLWFSQKKSDDLGGVLLRDQSPGIAVHRTTASTKRILLLHLHNSVSKQSQIVSQKTK
ncbi:PA domain-containing protein [Frondihabitans sp. PhB188]|uniref:S8 family peptidase n=1 Tax=Frondihabitans sp. PhB188 TaxID=2485200 RepID=UPI000F4731BC|nr:S8 family serine peptidase [Frondihabitans sp. PhB188]ROQ37139.1 PA domain-containing protein [Frondihabitans sp. PhB188]